MSWEFDGHRSGIDRVGKQPGDAPLDVGNIADMDFLT